MKYPNKGIVYVLTNPAMPGLVKIGMTTRLDIDTRMKELYSTGVPVPFECIYACEVKSTDCVRIEKALHKAFEPNRINSNREFFKINPEQVTAILELFDRIDITGEVASEIDNDLTPDDRAANSKIKSSKRPPLNFREMGIKEGDILSFTNDKEITVTVIAEKKISFNNEILSLTAITRRLLGLDYSVQPIKYWEYKGKNLRDIYDDTYTLMEE